MKFHIQLWFLACLIGLMPLSTAASVLESNNSQDYIRKVIMRSTIYCGYYYSTFTCEHYLTYGQSMEYNDYSWGDGGEGGQCFYYYTVDSISLIPTVPTVPDMLTQFISNNNSFASLHGPIVSLPSQNFGMSDWATYYASNPTGKNTDRVLLEMKQRGVIDAKTTVRGPISASEATYINDKLTQGENVANANIALMVGVGALASRLPPLVATAVGLGAGYGGPLPARERVREGDILVTTTGIIYLGANSGIMVGQHLDIRIVNRNLPFVNDTGLPSFDNKEAQIIWEISSTVDNPEGKGVRLYLGTDGKIRFQVIQP